MKYTVGSLIEALKKGSKRDFEECMKNGNTMEATVLYVIVGMWKNGTMIDDESEKLIRAALHDLEENASLTFEEE